jgi:PAS domain S-box-containing protein
MSEVLEDLSVLIIEDNPFDAELNALALKKMGYSLRYECIETAGEMIEAIARQPWDLILSDYLMPKFDVLSALEIYRSAGLEIPFIVISGAIGEQRAVELIKAGAHDYLLKDNMTRFASVVKRELREAKLRQKLSEAGRALASSEERYRTMIEASPDGIIITDLKGIITDVSAVGLSLYETSTADDLVGLHFSRFVAPEDKKNLDEIFNRTLLHGVVQNVEIRLIKKNQKFFTTEVSATLLHEADGRPLSHMIIIRDVSQRKNLEMQLIHSERMAGLGQMASGIAHEINQPLNTISMAMDNIFGEISSTEKIDPVYLKKKADKIFDNITRIRNIIDHIRVFSREHDDFILTGFSLNASIMNAVSMISEQFRHHAIELRLALDDQLPPVTGNTYKFEQVILNLLSNARDAINEKEIKRQGTAEKLIEIKSFSEPGRIVVEVSDSGNGIAEENIPQVMLPFYTTKDPGKGTGLGLSVSYQIIKEMNGTIEFSSKLWEGTKIRIILKD